MADITMCGTTTCPIKDGCKRHTAIPNKDWQSWCDFSIHTTAGVNGYECDRFIEAQVPNRHAVYGAGKRK